MKVSEEVLRTLQELQGKPVSGQAIADRLGVSRAAVWRAVESLRSKGAQVEGTTRRGYCLGSSDILTEVSLRSHLSPGSPVSRIICLDTVDSTNTYAKRLALEGAGDGVLVVAEQQTGGRGRHGHSFLSPPGTGLYMTLLLRPTVELERFQMITIAAATAVCLALEDLSSLHPLIKWVNDIFLEQTDEAPPRLGKVCGILTEAVSDVESGQVESVAVGIGVNLTTRDFGGLETAGALFPAGRPAEGPPLGRAKLAAAIAERLMKFAKDLDNPELIGAYRQRSMLLGHELTYIQNGERRRGRALGVDDQGGLVIQSLNEGGEVGGTEVLRSGEVFEVRPLTAM